MNSWLEIKYTFEYYVCMFLCKVKWTFVNHTHTGYLGSKSDFVGWKMRTSIKLTTFSHNILNEAYMWLNSEQCDKRVRHFKNGLKNRYDESKTPLPGLGEWGSCCVKSGCYNPHYSIIQHHSWNKSN